MKLWRETLPPMPSIFICKVYFYQIQPWKNVEICGNELGGGFKYFLCSPLFGEDSHSGSYFSNGLKPPTSEAFIHSRTELLVKTDMVEHLNEVHCWSWVTTHPLETQNRLLQLSYRKKKRMFQYCYCTGGCLVILGSDGLGCCRHTSHAL